MRTNVTFFSAAFRQEKDEHDEPYFLGEDAAAWLSATLSMDELVQGSEFSDPFEEDWGWAILASHRGRPFIIGIGEYQVDEKPAWLCLVHSRLPFYKKWFGVNDYGERRSLCEAINRALASNARITDIRWYEEADFMRGDHDNWTAGP